MGQHFLSLTADQERFNASPAVRRHHDEVTALLLCYTDYSLVGRIIPLINYVTRNTRFLGTFFNFRQVLFGPFLELLCDRVLRAEPETSESCTAPAGAY